MRRNLSHPLSTLTALAAIGVLGLGCGSGSARAEDSTNLCKANLLEVGLILQKYRWEGYSFPDDLRSVVRITNSALFLCPATGHHAGRPEEVRLWTDYIYFEGAAWALNLPLLICPPTNHGGAVGMILWKAGPVSRASASEISSLIERPWLAATNAKPLELKRIREHTIVQVPSKYSTIYPHPYKPPRSNGADSGQSKE